MLTMALCDDEDAQRSSISGMLRDYAALHSNLAVKLSVFSSGWELLSAVEETGGFDLYLLDVVMPELSGIDLGIKLRELGCSGAIIYLTISPEYAVDSYAAQAFYYLIKPPSAELLNHVLDLAVASLEKRKTTCITVKTKDGLRLVRLDEILYTELSGRAVHYYLLNGERLDSMTVRTSFLKEMAPLLSDPRFFQCGASFVANLFYVTAVEKGFLHIGGSKRVPLSRGLSSEARRRWCDYWLGSGRELEK